jgi:hypothetical protein
VLVIRSEARDIALVVNRSRTAADFSRRTFIGGRSMAGYHRPCKIRLGSHRGDASRLLESGQELPQWQISACKKPFVSLWATVSSDSRMSASRRIPPRLGAHRPRQEPLSATLLPRTLPFSPISSASLRGHRTALLQKGMNSHHSRHLRPQAPTR